MGKTIHGCRNLVRGTQEPAVPVALAAWRTALCEDLGGVEALSTAQLTLVELATRDRAILDAVDGWLLTQASMVNKRKRSLLPVIADRMRVADALQRRLLALGLERRARDVSVVEQVAALHASGEVVSESTPGEWPEDTRQTGPIERTFPHPARSRIQK